MSLNDLKEREALATAAVALSLLDWPELGSEVSDRFAERL